jgi:lipopolysaccharide/colanic/teichoic acid biosynthesis glycosyltransferase
MHKKGLYEKFIKRSFVFFGSLFALIILSPLILIIAILVRIKLGYPVIFKQKRPGLNNKIFSMYKFRSMTTDKDNTGRLLPDEERMTKFGSFLRATSLDELPELFNILKGEMSFVGPRPQLIKDLVFMDTDQILRHSVRPGLTGYAQVNGRNHMNWETKFDMDIDYVFRISFFRDIRILLKTIVVILKKEGVNGHGSSTSQDFGDYLLQKGKIDSKTYIVKIGEAEKLEKGVFKFDDVYR